jgi:ABC-type multidrug transport system fused ATPase/permease subunit
VLRRANRILTLDRGMIVERDATPELAAAN